MKLNAFFTALALTLPFALASPAGGKDYHYGSGSGTYGPGSSNAGSYGQGSNGYHGGAGVSYGGANSFDRSNSYGAAKFGGSSFSGGSVGGYGGRKGYFGGLKQRDDGDDSNPWNNNPKDVEDLRVLNYALTYEYLAAAFYEYAFTKWSPQDFKDYGLDDAVYGGFQQIHGHRREYVAILQNAISSAGLEYLPPCTYNFEYTKNIGDFINHSEFFEVTSTSMYQGTLKMISNKDYSALAGSILGVQARHSGWIQYATKKKNPWNTAFEAPLVVNDIWTTGDPFFSTCPPGGPGLPSLPTGITQYPLFSVDPSDTIVPGNKVTIDLSEAFTSNPSSIPNDSSDKKLFTVFSVSWGTHMRPMSKGDNSDDSHKYSVEVPHELSSIGAVYVYVVQATDDEASHPHFEVNESNAVAGPRVWMFGFDSEGKPDNGYELFSGSRTVALVN